MIDNEDIANELSGTGLEEITFEPDEKATYPNDTIQAEMSEERLEPEEVTEIIHELETYKVINVQGGQKLEETVPMKELVKKGG